MCLYLEMRMKSLLKISHRSSFRYFSSTTHLHQSSSEVIVISGASSGIGEEIALKYAGKQTKLILGARRLEKLNEVAQRCLSNGAVSADVIQCDVSQENDCKTLIQKTIELHGKIDVLVLNAGVGQVTLYTFFLEAMKDDVNIRQFMDINYYGCVYPTIAALPHLQSTNGRIMVVSSIGGIIPFPRQTLYNASKYALMGFFDSLRMELLSKKSKVSITMICPGFVKTEITSGGGIGKDGKPVGSGDGKKSSGLPVKMISAEECATEAIKATDTRKSLVVIPKWYLPVVYARKLFPSFVDNYLIKVFAPTPKKKAEK